MADHPVGTDLGRRVWALFTAYRSSLVLIVVAVLVSSGLGIVTPFLTQAAFDRALFPAGGGVDIRISPNMWWRLDGRFYTTFGANYIAIDCGGQGSCSGSANTVIFTEFAATTGLAFRFGAPSHHRWLRSR